MNPEGTVYMMKPPEVAGIPKGEMRSEKKKPHGTMMDFHSLPGMHVGFPSKALDPNEYPNGQIQEKFPELPTQEPTPHGFVGK